MSAIVKLCLRIGAVQLLTIEIDRSARDEAAREGRWEELSHGWATRPATSGSLWEHLVPSAGVMAEDDQSLQDARGG
jgi:hypothetical protein